MLITMGILPALFGVDPLGGLEHIRLWEGTAPASVGSPDKNVPMLVPFVPKHPNGTAVVVCPGGGYGMHAVGHEGRAVAEWLNQRGITAFVLKYRIVQYDRPAPLHPAPLLDLQRAIRWVRAHSDTYHLDPRRVGVWGFSAGGHLASTAAVHFDAGRNDGDAIDRHSCRPDFAILAYPVIVLDGRPAHAGSRRNLLGNQPDPKLLEFYSTHKHVRKDTPPTFLFHTEEDTAVPAENSRMFAAACREKNVPVELVIYPKGPHGVGLATNDPVLSPWTVKLEAWLKSHQLLGQ
jgi:acetyl esterase/lipase